MLDAIQDLPAGRSVIASHFGATDVSKPWWRDRQPVHHAAERLARDEPPTVDGDGFAGYLTRQDLAALLHNEWISMGTMPQSCLQSQAAHIGSQAPRGTSSSWLGR